MISAHPQVFTANFFVPIGNFNFAWYPLHHTHKKIEAMNREVIYCPICIIKPQQHFGNELSFTFSHSISIMNDYIHQILHHQIIPNTFHFRTEHFDSSTNQTLNCDSHHEWHMVSLGKILARQDFKPATISSPTRELDCDFHFGFMITHCCCFKTTTMQ